jgi:23S rRNA (uracil1939-C5)-methyltransferase
VTRLLALQSPRLIIVSCDPATLARDLAALAGGGYSLVRLALVDLFPRTCHMEAVAELAPRPPAG